MKNGVHRGDLKAVEQERIVAEATVKWAWLERPGERVVGVGPQRRKAVGVLIAGGPTLTWIMQLQ